jgi:hypothetical protein
MSETTRTEGYVNRLIRLYEMVCIRRYDIHTDLNLNFKEFKDNPKIVNHVLKMDNIIFRMGDDGVYHCVSRGKTEIDATNYKIASYIACQGLNRTYSEKLTILRKRLARMSRLCNNLSKKLQREIEKKLQEHDFDHREFEYIKVVVSGRTINCKIIDRGHKWGHFELDISDLDPTKPVVELTMT